MLSLKLCVEPLYLRVSCLVDATAQVAGLKLPTLWSAQEVQPLNKAPDYCPAVLLSCGYIASVAAEFIDLCGRLPFRGSGANHHRCHHAFCPVYASGKAKIPPENLSVMAVATSRLLRAFVTPRWHAIALLDVCWPCQRSCGGAFR